MISPENRDLGWHRRDLRGHRREAASTLSFLSAGIPACRTVKTKSWWKAVTAQPQRAT